MWMNCVTRSFCFTFCFHRLFASLTGSATEMSAGKVGRRGECKECFSGGGKKEVVCLVGEMANKEPAALVLACEAISFVADGLQRTQARIGAGFKCRAL